MAAHINITSTHGIVLATGAEADDVQKTQSVEIADLADQETGEYIAASPVNMVTTEVVISGDGPGDLTDVTAGAVAVPATLEIDRVEIGEAPNARCTFSIAASSVAAFSDPGTVSGGDGVEPTIADLEIVSVEYAIAERVSRSREVEKFVLVGLDGAPVAKAKAGRKDAFSVAGRGDLPTGPALGTGGVSYAGSDTGIVIASRLMEGEKRKDWNRWSIEGVGYPAAA